MEKMYLPEDFKEFLKLLNEHDVQYLVVGGYAVGYHGYPRATGDLDVWIAIEPLNAEKMVKVMQKFGFDVPELSIELFLKQNNIVRMGYYPIRIEILTNISGVSFKECFDNKIVDDINGLKVNFINVTHLKINKKASGRHKDLNDLENLP